MMDANNEEKVKSPSGVHDEHSWIMSTEQIQSLMKHVEDSMEKISEHVYENTINAIKDTTSYIKGNTEKHVVLVVKDCKELLERVNKLTFELMVKAGDGCDNLREKLGESLKELSAAIAEHEHWAESFVKQNESHVRRRSASTIETLKTHYERALNSIIIALAITEYKAEKTIEEAVEKIEQFVEELPTKEVLADEVIEVVKDVYKATAEAGAHVMEAGKDLAAFFDDIVLDDEPVGSVKNAPLSPLPELGGVKDGVVDEATHEDQLKKDVY